MKSTKRLISFLQTEYKIPSDKIIGHGEVKNTACPGRFFSIAQVTHGARLNSLSDSQSQE